MTRRCEGLPRGGIATWGENPAAATNLEYGLQTRWTNNLAPYFTGPGQGGVFQEGSAYGSAIGKYSTVPLGTASLLGRDLYRETKFFREAVIYMAHVTLPAPTYNKNNGGSYWEMFPFADDERFFDGGMPARGNYGTFMLAMADYRVQPATWSHGRRWPQAQRRRQLAAVARGPLAVTRDDGLLAEHHRLWRSLGRLEPRGGAQSFARGRPWTGVGVHPRSVERLPARESADPFLLGRRPHAGLSSHPLSLDNAAVAHLEREFVFVRPFETLVVFDRIESTTASAAKTFLAHFETTPAVDAASRVVIAINGPQAVRVTTLVPANPTYRPIVNEGGSIGQFRLEIETSGAAQSYFLHVIQAKGASDASVTASVSDNGSSYTVTLTHPSLGTASVTMLKGRVSSGGALTVGSQTFALSSGVTHAAVNDQGVTWGGTTPAPWGRLAAPQTFRFIR